MPTQQERYPSMLENAHHIRFLGKRRSSSHITFRCCKKTTTFRPYPPRIDKYLSMLLRIFNRLHPSFPARLLSFSEEAAQARRSRYVSSHPKLIFKAFLLGIGNRATSICTVTFQEVYAETSNRRLYGFSPSS